MVIKFTGNRPNLFNAYITKKGTLTISGIFYGVLASSFCTLNAIYTKKSLPVVDDNIWKLTMYNNANAFLIFLPLIFIFDEHTLVLNFPKLTDAYFWFAMTVSGVLGFSVSYVTSLQIQVTTVRNLSEITICCTNLISKYIRLHHR